MMGPEELLEKYWDGSLPINPIVFCQQLGIDVIQESIKSVLGEFSKETARMVIKKDLPSKAKRFIIAHMLGHLLLDHESCSETTETISKVCLNPVEQQASAFASKLLMPSAMIRFLILEQGVTSLESIAVTFGVSTVAVEFRLKMLKMI